MKLLVIEHDHVSALGPMADRFEQRGYEVSTYTVVSAESFQQPGVTPDYPDFTGFDAVVLMGAPWSTYSTTVASRVLPELEQVAAADEAGVPILGICFGGQLLAAALGGSVGASEKPELGWTDVEVDDVVPSGPWFQWHGDRWQTPPEAREVARNTSASQAFVLRRNLAVQFHPEVTSSTLAGWLSNGGAEHLASCGIDPEQLMAATRERESEAQVRAHRLVDSFLDIVAVADGPSPLRT